MTARCLLLRSIATLRFWQLTNGHIIPPCGIIIFEMRDLKVIWREMFGNEFGRIPPTVMW
jgi:hypothetical protein